jgi:fatty acid desaturase
MSFPSTSPSKYIPFLFFSLLYILLACGSLGWPIRFSPDSPDGYDKKKSPYFITRFWNTISNAACFAAAAAAYHFFPGPKETRFRYLFATLFLVGLGSVLFHGTLRHKMQLLGKQEEK